MTTPTPAPPLPSLVIPFTENDILALFGRLLPFDYLEGLKEGTGYELLQAIATVTVRISQAAQNVDAQQYILSATGGQFATGSVQFSRTDPAGSPVITIQAGTVVTTSRGDRRFVTTKAATFPTPDGTTKTVTAPIRALDYGYQYNVPGQVTAADGTILPGEIDTILTLLAIVTASPTTLTFAMGAPDGVAFVASTAGFPTAGLLQIGSELVVYNGILPTSFTGLIRGFNGTPQGAHGVGQVVSLAPTPVIDSATLIAQPSATSGGLPAGLDELGNNRGIPRRSGEGDVAYRVRLRQLLATVTPAAIKQAIASAFQPYGVTADFIECFNMHLQTVWNAPHDPIFVLGNPTPYDSQAANTFVWYTNNSSSTGYVGNFPAYPFTNRWLDSATERACFIVVVPNLGAIFDCGFAWNDTAMSINGTVSPDTGGQRGLGVWYSGNLSVFDPSTLPANFVQGGYNGFDLPKQTVYRGLYDTLLTIKAAGVLADLELKGQ